MLVSFRQLSQLSDFYCCLELRRLVSFAAGAAKAERAMEAMVAMDVPGVVLAERGVGMRLTASVPLGRADIVSEISLAWEARSGF